MPMELRMDGAPDYPFVRAATYGPLVLSGGYGDRDLSAMPRIEPKTIRPDHKKPLAFTAEADGKKVPLIPIARMHHQHYTVYWMAGEPEGPTPPRFAAWYPFDESSGTTAPDASGHGNAATLVGGCTWTAGHSGRAVDLDGADGHVRMPDGLIDGFTALTLAAWVRLDRALTWSRVFDIGTGTGVYAFLTPRSGDGTLRFAITTGGAGGEKQLNAAAPPTGVWKHLAVTLSTHGPGVLYVDGTEVAGNADMAVQMFFLWKSSRNFIGRSQYSADPYLDGRVDDARVYSQALTSEEVRALLG